MVITVVAIRLIVFIDLIHTPGTETELAGRLKGADHLVRSSQQFDAASESGNAQAKASTELRCCRVLQHLGPNPAHACYCMVLKLTNGFCMCLWLK